MDLVGHRVGGSLPASRPFCLPALYALTPRLYDDQGLKCSAAGL
jgi:hypothetical protein